MTVAQIVPLFSVLLMRDILLTCGGGDSGGSTSPAQPPDGMGVSPTWRSTADYPSVSSRVRQASSGSAMSIAGGAVAWPQKPALGIRIPSIKLKVTV